MRSENLIARRIPVTLRSPHRVLLCKSPVVQVRFGDGPLDPGV